MKKITRIIAIVTASVALQNMANAQMVNYKITKDDPKDVTNFQLAVDVIGMDFGFKNLEGGALLGLGFNGYATIKERLGVESSLRFGYFNLSGDGMPIWFEAGGFLNLGDKTKTRMAQIVLSSTSSGNYTYTKSISVPAQRRKLRGVRGGIVMHTFPWDANSYRLTSGAQAGTLQASTTGIYAGIGSNTIRNVFVNTDNYGIKNNSGMLRYYLDVFMLPLWTASSQGTGVKGEIHDNLSTGEPASDDNKYKYNPIGFRFGMEVRPAEIRRKKSEGRARGLYVRMDFGKRPIEGAYIYIGMGFTVMRKKLTVLGYQKPASEQNTFE